MIRAAEPTKIALTIPTGRPQVKQVVGSFLANAEHYGYDPKNFSIYLAIDTSYQNKELKDFRLDPKLEQRVGKVHYISEEDRRKLGEQVTRELNVDPKIAQVLFSGNGYSKQRNSAMTHALKDGNDVAICFDDDEAPYAPIKKTDGKTTWTYPDFFTPHLRALLSGTDITKGGCLGYFSPIPSDFQRDIPRDLRKKLGEAIELGNEVITGDSFLNLFIKQFRYLPEAEALDPNQPIPVEWGMHGKPIPAGNMGVNLNSMRNGKVPAFYTPPNARGEDTIFGLQLQDVEVKEVGSYMFHDPFGLHPEVLEGRFPKKPKQIPITPDSKERFASALTGWLKYAPILIAMTSPNLRTRNQRIEEMVERIGPPTETISRILDCPEINDCRRVLRNYGRNVDGHLHELAQTQKEWRENIIPSLQPALA
jgi:hypothetical protein